MLFADQEAEALQAEGICSQRSALRNAGVAGNAALPLRVPRGSSVFQILPSPET